MTLPATGLDLLTPARRLLAYTVSLYEEAGVELPERRFIAAGQANVIAWDCEQLAVVLAGVSLGSGTSVPALPSGLGSPASVVTRNATLQLQLVRCTGEFGDGLDGLPGNEIPTAEVITAAGEQQMIDAGLISQVTANLAAGADSAFAPRHAQVTFGDVTGFGPAGCLWGLTTSITFTAGELR